MEHPAIDDIAAYLEHRLDDASRRRVEAHLVDCGECRREVLEGERVLRGVPGRRVAGRRPLMLLGTLAAAGIVLFAVLPRGGTSDVRSVERSPDASGSARPIVVVAPEDAARLNAAPDSFVWRSVAGVSLYKFTLTDEQGHVLWSASTRDSLLRPPGSLEVPASARYYWYVDALRADGGAVSSGVHAFRVR